MHILIELACFATPAEVAESVKVQFGMTLSRQCIEAHNPERRAGAKLKPHWRAVFYDARAKLQAELDGIGIAHRSVRLRRLERMLVRAEEMGNLQLVADILAQAAREVGGAYLKR